VGAQQFWLKNRAPEEWRDKQHVEQSGTVSVKPDLSALTPDELRALAGVRGTAKAATDGHR